MKEYADKQVSSNVTSATCWLSGLGDVTYLNLSNLVNEWGSYFFISEDFCIAQTS